MLSVASQPSPVYCSQLHSYYVHVCVGDTVFCSGGKEVVLGIMNTRFIVIY